MSTQVSRKVDLPHKDAKVGLVIEILEEQSRSQSLSTLPRRAKFVVVAVSQTGGSTVKIIPIRTYNDRGVDVPGVIASHHCIVHTGQTPPRLTNAELPRRQANSNIDAVRPKAIRVLEDNRHQGLDPMSRLDLSAVDTIELARGSGSVEAKVWGRVHEDSLAPLMMQVRDVQRAISADTPGPANRSQGSSRSTTIASVAATAGSSRSTVDNSVMTGEQLEHRLRALQQYAQQRKLSMPNITSDQVKSMSKNPAQFQAFMNRLKEIWRQETEEREDEEDSEDDSEDG